MEKANPVIHKRHCKLGVENRSTKCVPEEIYEQYRKQQDVKKTISYSRTAPLIGRSAIVKIMRNYNCHLLKMRVSKERNNTFHLLYLLNTPIVQKQIEKYTFIQGNIYHWRPSK